MEVSGEEIVLHGDLGSKRFNRVEVSAFEMRRYETYFRLDDGSVVKAYGLGASGVANRRSQEQIAPLVDELNRLVSVAKRDAKL